MGYLSSPKLPVIDFSDQSLQPGTDSWSQTRKNVALALEEFGCFAATYDKVSVDLHNAIFHQMDCLFDLPVEVKAKNTSEKPYHGYSPVRAALPLLEVLAIDNGSRPESIQNFVKTLWPEGNERFHDAAELFTKNVSELEHLVKRMVFESYGAEKYYQDHVDSNSYLVRFMKYRSPRDNKETEIGCNVHTDKSVITILHQNDVGGLEVQNTKGEWISFEPCPTSFVVMAGDAFMAWSNGRIHSPPHRVLMKSGVVKGTRYSIGMFAFHTGVIQIPPEFADDQHPLQYRDFDHYGLLEYYLAQSPEDQTVSTAKPYCGI